MLFQVANNMSVHVDHMGFSHLYLHPAQPDEERPRVTHPRYAVTESARAHSYFLS